MPEDPIIDLESDHYFMGEALRQAAQRVIERESVIRLSQKDVRMLILMADNPPEPNKRLKDAVMAFKSSISA